MERASAPDKKRLQAEDIAQALVRHDEQIAMGKSEHWQNDAACAQLEHPEIMDQEPKETPPEIIAFCGKCAVRAECFQYAMDTNQQYGIWAGLSADQRKALKRRAERRAFHQKRLAQRSP
jgi:WhiB family redox-sensing transcriptional regulator